MTQNNRIGLVGLGRMGYAIAERLVDQGAQLVVWNRTPGKSVAIAGSIEADSPADLASRVDFILVIVRDAAALHDVYKGANGLGSADLSGKIVIEMSTATIHAVCDVLAIAQAAGAAVIDAPVSGSIGPARLGKLMVMAGGDAATFAAATPVLEKIANRVVHVGPVGSGITMKLVVNLPLASYWQTLGEALGLGLRNGLSLDTMLSVIADSKAAIGALPSKIERILNSDLPAEFDLAGMAKDLAAMCDSATAKGHSVPACEAARQSAAAAVDAGWGERDLAQLTRFAAESTKYRSCQ